MATLAEITVGTVLTPDAKGFRTVLTACKLIVDKKTKQIEIETDQKPLEAPVVQKISTNQVRSVIRTKSIARQRLEF